MTKNRTYVILIIIIIVFFGVMFGLFGIRNLQSQKQEVTLLVGDNTIWHYKKKKWYLIKKNAQIQKLNWQTYQVYSNNEKVGSYSLWHDDKWYAFDSKNNAVPLNGSLLAYRANFDMQVASFQEDKIDDRTYVDEILTENNLSISSEFTSSSKVSIDYDSDGKKEDFYVISNAFPLDFNPDTIFSFVFMVKDGKIFPIYTDISPNHSFNGCKPFFSSFLDTNHDGKYEFVLSCGRYSVAEQVDMLYHFENGEFKIIISNQ